MFYDYPKYKNNMKTLNDCLKFISLPYYRTELSFYSYKSNYSCNSVEQILKAITDENDSLYMDF